MTRHYLLTGATGFLGGELLAELLRSGARVTCLVRARRHDPEARLRAMLAGTGVDAAALRVVGGDVTRDGCGLAESDLAGLRGRVDEIVHAAALIGFLMPPEQLRQVNVGGTRNALALARSLGGGAGLCHVSTAYAAGRVGGTVRDDAPLPAAPRAFRNPYEASKHAAEAVLRDVADVPWAILRPSIIVGSSVAPHPVAGHSLTPLLKALATERNGLIPARRSASVDFVSVDYVARAAAHIVADRTLRSRTFHLVSGAAHPVTLGTYIDAIDATLRRDLPRLRCIAPAAYSLLARPILSRMASPAARRVVRIGDAFLPYFANTPRFDDRGTRAALAGSGITPPEPVALFRRILHRHVAQRAGAVPAQAGYLPEAQAAE